jgi:hypothetical protein
MGNEDVLVEELPEVMRVEVQEESVNASTT